VGTTPRDRLLRRLEGWAKLTEGAHRLDVKGSSIQKGIFSEMKRRMPKQYKNDPGLRWLVGDAIAVDWADVVSDRGTILGDAALQGAEMAPLGTPMVRVPLIPDDAPITITAASSGQVLGGEFGPFIIDATCDTLKLRIDAVGVTETIVLPHGTLNTVTVAQAINAALAADVANYGIFYANVARDDREGRLLLTSPTTGVASAIKFEPVAVGVQAYVVLGLLPAPVAPNTPAAEVVFAGAASGSANLVNEGSFVLLTNPKNLVWGILDGTRIFTEFNKNTDQIESIVYNQVDAKIENVDAIVKAVNVRRRTLVI
jgi:hypothetical protein